MGPGALTLIIDHGPTSPAPVPAPAAAGSKLSGTSSSKCSRAPRQETALPPDRATRAKRSTYFAPWQCILTSGVPQLAIRADKCTTPPLLRPDPNCAQ